MLKSLTDRLANSAGRALKRVTSAIRAQDRPASPVLGLVADLFRPRRLLLAENVLLRQQLLVLRRQVKQGLRQDPPVNCLRTGAQGKVVSFRCSRDFVTTTKGAA